MAFDRTSLLLLGALIATLVAGPFLPAWFTFLATVALSKALVVLGVMLLMRAGLVSFGQGLYYGIGAYGAGLAANMLGIRDAFLLLALGVAASAVVAAIVSVLLARYRDIFFAMLSLAFSMIFYGLLVRSAALGSTDGFNLPPANFAGWSPVGATGRSAVFMLTAVLAFLAAIGAHRYLKSTLGMIGEAIRTNEIRVEYLGASVRRAIQIKVVLAAALAGAGGVLTALAASHIDPGLAYWTTSGEFVFVALLSGTGHVAAPLIGCMLFELIRTFAVQYAPYTWQMVVGASMLAVIMFLPGGLWSLVRMRLRRTA
jgi:ABC-type branched-subunit amino acid transport system permease subunit